MLISTLLSLVAGAAWAAPVTTAVKLDHFGYRPADAKVAVATTNPGGSVQIRTPAGAVAFTVPTNGGAITSKGYDGAPSGDTVWWIDFSVFATPGTYHLYVPSLGTQSYDFVIADTVYDDVVRAALKTFYYQRCNTPKLAAHAGSWADAASCHGSDAATGPAAGHTNVGTKDLRGGWHDAGDYNKYVWTAVSSAVLQMLRAYEDNPGVFADGDLDIPESGNGIPDLLDEIKWELDWLLKMQLPSGAVLYQMHVDGFASDAPPSADGNVRYYQNPTLESGAVFAGTLALAARIYAAEGMTAYAATLESAALAAWSWLQTQGGSEAKVWAAAELFRTEPTLTSARSYVDGFHASAWAGRFFDVLRYDTHAAVTYVQTPGATATVVANMRQNMADQVSYIFASDDLYRNGMPDWSYFWGSNQMRAAYGLFLLQAAKLGTTGSRTAADCVRHAQDFLHFFHGQNTLSMLYLTNMRGRGGEHSSYQFYHSWFGLSDNAFSRGTFMGKPASVVEPHYPYFAGTDNHGISDNKVATLGPAPGFVPGGPNKDYGGNAAPPLGALYHNRFYRDWADQTVWTVRTWEITENSIGYQGPYVALGAYFMSGQPSGCGSDAACSDGVFCNGAERCEAGLCVAGTNPCPGQSCNEATDTCFVDPCDRDGRCEAGETCANCAADCPSGPGGFCGNGVCEPTLGEDCLSCAADCRGRQGGSPRGRFCCGDGAGVGPVGCSDARCTESGFSCSNTPAAAYCCGDGTCGGPEDRCVCAVDCGAPAANEIPGGTCADGSDNDCDGLADCDDAACDPDPVCAPLPGCDGDGACESGESCTTCPGDCAGRTGGSPSKRYCCGNGVLESAEGSGAVCDGNP